MISKNVKKRNWAFILYPESAPEDWYDILTKCGVQSSISPLHDKDLDPTGTPKKAHYHVILCYNGPTTYNAVNTLCESLSASIPQPLEQVRGYYRYFTHKDNPEKYQYDEKDIQCINGFNILDFCELTKSEVIIYKRNLQTLIRDYNITEYCDFMDYLLDNQLVNEYHIASTNTYFFEKYITSMRNKMKLN